MRKLFSTAVFAALFLQAGLSGLEAASWSYEDLLFMDIQRVSVASVSRDLTLRESPAIVTVITAEQIKDMGARDIIDILHTVPGFHFGVDVLGVVGIGIRGQWAHEGKVLLLVDGQELNERMFTTIQLGNHFPVDNIKKIEIIRGPGSALYGGYAELGVIKITTFNAEESEGFNVTGTYSHMTETFSKSNIFASYGHVFSPDTSLILSGYYGRGVRSDRDFSDFYEDTYSMAKNSDLNPLFVNIGMKHRGLSLRLIYDRYETMQRDIFFVNAPMAVEQNFTTLAFEAKYDIALSENLKLTPQFNFKRQEPWYSAGKDSEEIEEDDPDSYEGLYADETVMVFTEKLLASYDINDNNNIILGLEFTQEMAKDNVSEDTFDGKDEVSYENFATYAQLLSQLPLFNLTLGARYDNHSAFGSAFSPRLGVTKVMDKLHFKLLANRAFRAPSISNIAYFLDPEGEQSKINPETTTVLEFETGYNFLRNMNLSVNLFNIVIEDPIIYYYDDTDRYMNYDKTGTRGFEVEYQYMLNPGYINLSYSYYMPVDNEVDEYTVWDEDGEVIDENVLLGFPTHKVALNSSFRFNDRLSVNPSLIYYGEKYAYTAVNDDDDLIAEKLAANYLLNLAVNYDRLFDRDISLTLGVHNILDEKYDFVQPFDGYHAPLPGPSREYTVKLSYSF